MPLPWEISDPSLSSEQAVEARKVALESGLDYFALRRRAQENEAAGLPPAAMLVEPEVWRMARSTVVKAISENYPHLPPMRLNEDDNVLTAAAKEIYNAPVALSNFLVAIPEFFGVTGLDLVGMAAEGLFESTRGMVNRQDLGMFGTPTAEYNAQYLKDTMRSFGGAFTRVYDAAMDPERFEAEGGWKTLGADIHADPIATVLAPAAIATGLAAKGAKPIMGKYQKVRDERAAAQDTMEKLEETARNQYGTYDQRIQQYAQKKVDEIKKTGGTKDVGLVKRIVDHHDRRAPQTVTAQKVVLNKEALNNAKAATAAEAKEAVAQAGPVAGPVIEAASIFRQKQIDKLMAKVERGEPVEIPQQLARKDMPPVLKLPPEAMAGRGIRPRDMEPKLEHIEDIVGAVERGFTDPNKGIAKLKNVIAAHQKAIDKHPEMHTFTQWEALEEKFQEARERLIQLGKLRREVAATELPVEKLTKSVKEMPSKPVSPQTKVARIIEARNQLAKERKWTEARAKTEEAINEAKALKIGQELTKGLPVVGKAEEIIAKAKIPEKPVAAPAGRVTFQEYITADDLRKNPDKVYLFGDNLQQQGYGGQARAMRGKPNAIGIPTKKAPSMIVAAFFKDSEFEANKAAIDAAFAKIPPGKQVVIPKAGLGTGFAKLDKRAPKTFEYIRQKIRELQGRPAEAVAEPVEPMKVDISSKKLAGKPLTPEQIELEKEFEGYREIQRQREEGPKAEASKFTPPAIDRRAQIIDSFKRKLAGGGEKFMATVPGGPEAAAFVELVADLGAYYIEAGVRGFEAWSERVVKDLGPKAKQFLDKAWRKLGDLRWSVAMEELKTREERLAYIDDMIEAGRRRELSRDQLELLQVEEERWRSSHEEVSGLKEDADAGRPVTGRQLKWSGPAYDIGLEAFAAGFRESFDAWAKAVTGKMVELGLRGPVRLEKPGTQKGKIETDIAVERRWKSMLKEVWDRSRFERDGMIAREQAARLESMRADLAKRLPAPPPPIEIRALIPEPKTLGERIYNRLSTGMSPAQLDLAEDFILKHREEFSDHDVSILKRRLGDVARDIRGVHGAEEMVKFLFDKPMVEDVVESKPSMTMDDLYDFTMAELLANQTKLYGAGELKDVLRTKINEMALLRSQLSDAAKHRLQRIEWGSSLHEGTRGVTPEEMYAEALTTRQFKRGITKLRGYLQDLGATQNWQIRQELGYRGEKNPPAGVIASVFRAMQLLENLEADNKAALQRQINDSVEKMSPKERAAAVEDGNYRLASDRRTSEIVEVEAMKDELVGKALKDAEELEAEALADLEYSEEFGGAESVTDVRTESRFQTGKRSDIEPKLVPETELLTPAQLSEQVASWTQMVRDNKVQVTDIEKWVPPDIAKRVRANLRTGETVVDNAVARMTKENQAERKRKARAKREEMKRRASRQEGYAATVPGAREVGGVIETLLHKEKGVEFDPTVDKLLKEGKMNEVLEGTSTWARMADFLRNGRRNPQASKWNKLISKTAAMLGNSFVYEWDLRDAPNPHKIIDMLRIYAGNERSSHHRSTNIVWNILQPLYNNHTTADLPKVYDEFKLVVQLRDMIESWHKWKGVQAKDYVDLVAQLEENVAAGSQYKGVEQIVAEMRNLAEAGKAELLRKAAVPKAKGADKFKVDVRMFEEGGKFPSKLDILDIVKVYKAVFQDAIKKPGMARALRNHNSIVREMGNQLAAQGLLDPMSVRTFYFPHYIKEFFSDDPVFKKSGVAGKLREKFRSYTQRRTGSERPYELDYVSAMYRLTNKFYIDQGVHNLLSEIAREYTNWEKVDAITGEPHDGWRYYDFSRGIKMTQLDNKWANEIERVVNDLIVNGKFPKEQADARGFIAWRSELIKRGTFVPIPEVIAERLDKFAKPETYDLWNLLKPLTSTWKTWVILQSLPTFLGNQIIGDMEMLFRESAGASKPNLLVETYGELWNRTWDRPMEAAKAELWKDIERYLVVDSGMVVGDLDLNRQFRHFYDRPVLTQAVDFFAAAKNNLMKFVGTREGMNRASLFKWLVNTEQGQAHMRKYFPKLVDQLKHTSVTWKEEVPVGEPKPGEQQQYETVVKKRRLVLDKFIIEDLSDPQLFGKEASEKQLEAIEAKGGKPPEELVTRVKGRTVAKQLYEEAPPEITVDELNKIMEVGKAENGNKISDVKQIEDLARVAAKISRDSMIDYGALPPFEQHWLRGFLVPFYPYYRYNLQNWAKMYSSRRLPEAMMKAVIPQLMIQAWNYHSDPEAEEATPRWQKGLPRVRIPGWKDEDGNPVSLSFALPSQDAISLIRDPFISLMRLLTPLLKIPFAQIMGRDPYSGMPILEGDETRYTLENLNPIIRKYNAARFEEQERKMFPSLSDDWSLAWRRMVSIMSPYYGSKQSADPGKKMAQKIRAKAAWNRGVDDAINQLKRQVKLGRRQLIDEGNVERGLKAVGLREDIQDTIDRLNAAKAAGPPDDAESLYGEIARLFYKAFKDDEFTWEGVYQRWADHPYAEQAATMKD